MRLVPVVAEADVNEQGDVKTIGRQEVHTGPTGLDIPELTEADLTENSQAGGPLSQQKLDDIAANLENAKAILRQRRDALGSDAAAIARAKSSNTEAAALYGQAPMAIKLRELQTLAEIAREKNLIVVTPSGDVSTGMVSGLTSAFNKEAFRKEQ